MSLEWIKENPPRWDDGKARIVGGAPAGTFQLGDHAPGAPVPGEWWRVESDGATVGYGWMDTTWNGGEVLMAVDPGHRARGIGTFIVEHLASEAAERGMNYIFNTVPDAHPDREGLTAWLKGRGFSGTEDGQLRRRVERTAD